MDKLLTIPPLYMSLLTMAARQILLMAGFATAATVDDLTSKVIGAVIVLATLGYQVYLKIESRKQKLALKDADPSQVTVK